MVCGVSLGVFLAPSFGSLSLSEPSTPPILYPEADGHRHATAFSPGLAGTDLVCGIHNSFFCPASLPPTDEMLVIQSREKFVSRERLAQAFQTVCVCAKEFNSVQAPQRACHSHPFLYKWRN